MRKAKQRDFFEDDRSFAPRRHTHGGANATSLRKIRRPLDRRRPVHLVLKSEVAKEKFSLLAPRNRLAVERLLKHWAARFRVTIHYYQNAGNHLHIVASFNRTQDFQDFLRTIGALIARHVTGARRGKPFGRRFWEGLAFTRVIMGWRDLKGVKRYVDKNRMEVEIHPLARKSVEEHEAAMREARRRGCDVWEILERRSARTIDDL